MYIENTITYTLLVFVTLISFVTGQVSVHNGWKFVNEPHIVYLEPEYEGGKSGKKTPASQSSLRGTFWTTSQSSKTGFAD